MSEFIAFEIPGEPDKFQIRIVNKFFLDPDDVKRLSDILIDKVDNVPADYLEQTRKNLEDASAEYLARFKESDRFIGNQASMSIRHLEVVDRSRTPIIHSNYRDLLAKRKKGKNKPF